MVKIIAANPDDVLQTLGGLKRLVQLERDKVAANLPNSEEGRREQKAQLSWFDELLDGLAQIKHSLENSTPEQTVKDIEGVSHKLGNWYKAQALWVQRSIRMTATGATSLGLFNLGLPAFASIVLPSMFFAKEEILDVKDMLKKD